MTKVQFTALKNPTADTTRQFVIVGITDGSGHVRYIARGRLGPARYSWTSKKSEAKKFRNQSEPSRIAQDWIRPYEDRRVTVLVEKVMTVTGAKNPTVREKKNPRAFGKRSRRPRPKTDAEKMASIRRRHQARVASALAKRGVVKHYVVRAHTHDGKTYFWTGLALDTNKAKAAIYRDHRQAERIMEMIEERQPDQVRYVDVVQA